jgi:hypothetical protein
MRIYTFILIVLVPFLSGCADSAAVGALGAEIKEIESKIAEGKTELSKYGEGSPLHSLVSFRIATHEQTLAMVKQKWTAVRWYPRFSYTVDGRPYAPPDNVEVKIAEAQVILADFQRQVGEAEREVARTGGLFRTLAQLRTEVARIPVAQLEYQIAAYKHGFPPYIPNLNEAIERAKK